MPLLKKKKFCKAKLTDEFRNDEEVFYCSITDEIFRDYDDFCARVILCNSMVWTCSLTGKHGLTYSEAEESESHARKIFRDFPTELRVPTLFLASKTHRTSFFEMVEDVYNYIKDRYFIGENVEASFSGNNWHDAHVLQVIAPTQDKLKNVSLNGQSHQGPPATLYHYEVEQMDPEDEDLSEIMVVNYDHIRRKKKLSREKLKLFLKPYIEQNELHIFMVKPSVLDKFGIHKLRFNQIFDGLIPTFEVSKKLKKLDYKQTTLVPFLKNNKSNDSNKNKQSNDRLIERRLTENSNNLMEKMRQQQIEYKQKKEDLKKSKAEERLKLKEENIKISYLVKEWYKPKEDLELEDQKILPVPEPVCTQISDEYMGDVLTILEFVKKFSKFLSANHYFPGGLTFKIIEKALVEKEVGGPLMDMIQMFLSALFDAQLQEATQYNTKVDTHFDIKGREYNVNNASLTEATYFATHASSWSLIHQGISLTNLPLYTLTASEILRLHLLSSGARIVETGSRWRYSYRGSYNSEDDPGLYFCIKYPHILKALSLYCVTELPIGDILKIIDCLISQLLTFAFFRDFIEDQLEKTKQAKIDYKMAQLADRKQEQEYAASKFKIKRECKENNTSPSAQLDLLAKDYEKKKADIEKKLKNLTTLSNQHQTVLGQDRAFRKYLKLESIPGVFVNFEEDNPGCCLEECIQQKPSLVNAGKSEIIEHIRKTQDANTSDKENAVVNGCETINHGLNGQINSNMSTNDSNKLLMCNANPDTCIVHSSTVVREKWSYLKDGEQLSELIESLNARGIYESELKQILATDPEYYSSLIERTQSAFKQGLVEDTNDNDADQKSRNSKSRSKQSNFDTTLGYPKELGTTLILQYALIDNILELEQKMFAGNLGSIKVKDREAWRESLLSRTFDFEKDLQVEDKSIEEEVKNDASKEYQDPGKHLESSIKIQNDSSNSISNIVQSDKDKFAIQSLAVALAQIAEGVDHRYLKKPLGNVNMRSDNSKTLSGVLGKWKRSLLASTSYCQIFVHYSSLDSCIIWSRSALYARCTICRKQCDSEQMLLCDNCNKGLHLYCHKPKLRSVPKGDWFCNVCQKEKEAVEEIKSFAHTAKKRLRIISQDSDTTSDDQPLVKKSRKTKNYGKSKISNGTAISENGSVYEDEEESESYKTNTENEETERSEIGSEVEREKNCEKCGLEAPGLCCHNCSELYHIECVNPPMRRIPRGRWVCHKCKSSKEGDLASDSDETKEHEGDNKIKVSNGIRNGQSTRLPNGHMDESETEKEAICEKCGLEAPGLCCHNCSELYHIECVNPPMHHIPRGEWICHKCKSSKKGDSDNVRRSLRRNNLPLNNSQLQELLTEIMKQDFAWPFLRPVNKHEVPDYYDIINNPMDFGTVKYKLNMGRYGYDADLMTDVALVFENCKLYNNEDDEVFQCGIKMLEYFIKKCHELGLYVPHEIECKQVLLENHSSAKLDLENEMEVD